MKNTSVQRAWRSRLTVAVGLGLTVGAAACSGGASSATSPSSVTPSSLAAKGPNSGQDTRDFSVMVTPTSVQVGARTLHVTVTGDATSGQSQKLGSVEIYVPSSFTIQSVSNISNNWTGGVLGQTVRVGAKAGNNKLDAGQNNVTFDINVTSTQCGTYPFTTAQASNEPYSTDPFSPNWTYMGSALFVTVTDCVAPVTPDCKAAPAVANEYLDSISFKGSRKDIIDAVAHEMTQGARFDGIEKCDVEAYRTAVIAFVKELLNG